jgi:protein SCO1/2
MVVLVAAQAAYALHWFGLGISASDTPVAIGGPFRLVAPDGRIVTDRDFRGKWMLVYFGYTSCPDTCPTALNAVANALDLLGTKAADIAPLFITIDPAHDTPAVMGAYAARFDRRTVGLTGTAAQIAQVRQAFRVYATPDAHATADHMVMEHSSVFIVMNPWGKFADVLNGNVSPDAMATRLRALDS